MMTNSFPKPYKGSDSYIFVSYAHADKERVFSILDFLASKQYRIWFDEGIDPGTEWDENIASHLQNCEGLIAFITKNYLDSDNCKDELNYARDLSKDRLLVYLEEVDLPAGMAMRLNRIQAVFEYKYSDKREFFGKLIETPMIKRNKMTIDAPKQKTPDLILAEWISAKWGCTDVSFAAKGLYGSTYRAYSREHDCYVAFKFYPGDLIRGEIPLFSIYGLDKLFLDIKHKNLCKTIGIEVERTSNMVVPYMVNEWVDGVTLNEYVRGKHLSLSNSLDIVKQILLGLHELHTHDMYYGDVKPQNIMVSGDRVVLCDYSSVNLNGTKQPDGITVIFEKFRSPERFHLGKVDFKSDIYEVGAILDDLTLKAMTFVISESDGREKYYFEEPSAPLNRIDSAVATIIKKATKEKPSDRYKNALKMIEDIDCLLQKID